MHAYIDIESARGYPDGWGGGGGGGGGGGPDTLLCTVACRKKFAERPDSPALAGMKWCASQQLCEGISWVSGTPPHLCLEPPRLVRSTHTSKVCVSLYSEGEGVDVVPCRQT